MSRIEELIGAGREYRRTQNIEIREAEEGVVDKKTVRGYATTFGDEYLLYDCGDIKVYEQIDGNAFDGCDMSDVIMQYDHTGRVFARLSNGTLRLSADEHGLYCEADLGGTSIGSDLYEEIKGGYTNKMSFGFRVSEDKREIVEDHENAVTYVHRTITKIGKLYDVSAVSLPANDGTEISARTLGDGLIAEVKQELLEKRAHLNKAKALKLLLEM